jgi:hypothetical protein
MAVAPDAWCADRRASAALLISRLRFDQPVVSDFGGVVLAHPGAEGANAARQVAHGLRYAACSEQEQDDG